MPLRGQIPLFGKSNLEHAVSEYQFVFHLSDQMVACIPSLGLLFEFFLGVKQTIPIYANEFLIKKVA